MASQMTPSFWWLIPHRWECWEGRWSNLSGLLEAVASDSWCAHTTAHWTGEGLGWGWWDACSFCLLHLSFVASCLPASNVWLAFLTDERQLSQSLTSCCHDWRLIPACASCPFKWSLQMLSWSTTITLSFLELADEDCFRHVYVFHPWDVASLMWLHLKQDGLYAGQAGFVEDFFVRHVALPFGAKDGAQAALMKLLT